jgi:hypothetical protein
MDEKKARTIALLLEKANANGVTEEEATAYTAKATELMIKYNISDAQLNVGRLVTEAITQCKFTYTGTYAPEQLRLTYWIASALGLQAYVTNVSGSTKILYVVGYENDITFARLIIGSLQIQCATATEKFIDFQCGTYGWERSTAGMRYKTKRGFIIGFADRVADRVKATRKQVIAESAAGSEVALVAREDQVKKWLEDAVPDLRAKKSTRKDNVSALESGRAAGDQADIGTTGVSNGHSGRAKAISA